MSKNLIITKSSSLADEKVLIQLKSLQPSTFVSLKLSVKTDDDFDFLSFGVFKSNKKGCIDLSQDQSYAGSYEGIDQMGLFWSMEPSVEHRDKFPRFHKKDVSKSMKYTLEAYNGRAESLNDLNSDLLIDTITFERWFLKEGVKVERASVSKEGFLGTLFIPEGEGPHPGVVVMFGGMPGLLEFKASLLASHGFASLALAFFGVDAGNTWLNEKKEFCSDLAYFEKAIDYMLQHKSIISSGVGLITISFSVHIALMLSTYVSRKIHCAVMINGFIHNLNVKYFYGNRSDLFVDCAIPDFFHRWYAYSATLKEGEVQNFHDLYPMLTLEDLDSMEDKGLIPFYENKGVAYMMIAGEEDRCVPASHYTNLFEALLKRADHKNYEILKYTGAGHLIEPPFAPLNKVTRLDKKPVNWGGVKKPHAFAQEHSWKKQINFLFRNIVGRAKI